MKNFQPLIVLVVTTTLAITGVTFGEIIAVHERLTTIETILGIRGKPRMTLSAPIEKQLGANESFDRTGWRFYQIVGPSVGDFSYIQFVNPETTTDLILDSVMIGIVTQNTIKCFSMTSGLVDTVGATSSTRFSAATGNLNGCSTDLSTEGQQSSPKSALIISATNPNDYASGNLDIFIPDPVYGRDREIFYSPPLVLPRRKPAGSSANVVFQASANTILRVCWRWRGPAA